MIKKELAKILANRMDISLFNAELMNDRFMRNIIYGLRREKKVVISNFGTLTVVERKEKSVLNPRTGERMTVPSYRKVVFKPSEDLSNKINPKA